MFKLLRNDSMFILKVQLHPMHPRVYTPMNAASRVVSLPHCINSSKNARNVLFASTAVLVGKVRASLAFLHSATRVSRLLRSAYQHTSSTRHRQ